MTNLLKMVLMTTMSKASNIIASARKESTITLVMTMMTKVSNLMTMMTNVNYDDNDDKSVSSDDCPRVNVAGSQLL